jgi:hypothetical protein
MQNLVLPAISIMNLHRTDLENAPNLSLDQGISTKPHRSEPHPSADIGSKTPPTCAFADQLFVGLALLLLDLQHNLPLCASLESEALLE